MRPKNLRSPYTWKERRIMIQDCVWFVPDYMPDYSVFEFPGWNSPELFNNDHPVKVEYCSGNGDWIAERALAEPDVNWVAVEIKFERVRKIWSKIKNYNLNNLVVISGEGFRTTAQYFPEETVSDVFINFPDPWPKERHWKNRIIQDPFVDEMWRILLPTGAVTFVTDDADYSDWTIATFQQHEQFTSGYPAPFYRTELSGYGSSWFDDLFREQGLVVRYHQFTKRCGE